MNLQRALLASLVCFTFLIGLTGCESCAPNGPRYTGTKSSSNMSMANSMWDVSGEGVPQNPPSER